MIITIKAIVSTFVSLILATLVAIGVFRISSIESCDATFKGKAATVSEATPDVATPNEVAIVATECSTVATEESTQPTETEIVEEVVAETYVDDEGFYDEVDYEEPQEEEEEEEPHEVYKSTADRDVVAAIAYLEAGNCSEYCQWLVVSALLNLAEYYDMTVEEVATTPSMFSVAYSVYSCYPSALSYQVADRVLSGDRDYNVMAFQMGCYHSFGTPYANVDGVYFSEY